MTDTIRDGAGTVGVAALSEADSAVRRGEWQLALDLLDRFDPERRSADALELRAQAAYGAGALEAATVAWEDLCDLLTAEGDDAGAARAAAMLALYLMMDTGLMAPVRGWLRRAERLVAGRDDVAAVAVIPLVRTYERLLSGDLDGVREQAARAIEEGERLDVLPAVVIGRVATARVRIFDGAVDEGLAMLDDVGTTLMSGTVDPLTTGMMYCELICAAQGLALYDRAREWTEVMDRWRHGAAFGGLDGRCRVHRAEMLRTSGPCDRAEEEALAACEALRPWMRREFGWPLVELGNIRLRMGDLAGAEESYCAAHERGWSPFPGLALCRLEQGDVDAASALIADAVAHPFRIPSKERPPFVSLSLAPVLDAQVEIAAVAGDVDTAARAADELGAIARSFPSRSLAAMAHLADARVALVRGNADGAIEPGVAAALAWADLGAPYESARARLVLGEAHRRGGRHDVAAVEWRAALATLRSFGARRWAARAAELIDELDRGATVGEVIPAAATGDEGAAPGGPRRAVFRRDHELRIVGIDGRTIHLRDLKGCRYLDRLLAEPGREFHALDLVAVEQGTIPRPAPSTDDVDSIAAGPTTGLPVLDAEAREAYRRRLAEVEADIDEATAANDLGRVELAVADREYLIRELERAVGLGGRPRTTGGSAERARMAVTRALRYAIDRIAEHDAVVGAHLRQCVSTGTYCSYVPDPLAPVDWER